MTKRDCFKSTKYTSLRGGAAKQSDDIQKIIFNEIACAKLLRYRYR